MFIGNLPFSVSSQQLRSAFQEFGTLLEGGVMYDNRERSRGFGIVVYENKEDAEEAINQMDQAKFNDRLVSVRFDRDTKN